MITWTILKSLHLWTRNKKSFDVRLSIDYAAEVLNCLRMSSTVVGTMHPEHEVLNRIYKSKKSSDDRNNMKWNNKPSADIALKMFFEQAKIISDILHLLKNNVWDNKLQEALQSSSVTFDVILVTQIFKADLPCDVAMSFFQWLKRQPEFRHNEYTYGVMLNSLGRAGRLVEMHQLLEEMKSTGCPVNSVTLSNIMLWNYKAKDKSGVAHHWKVLRQAGIKPSPAIYAVYIDLLVRTSQFKKIPAIFEEMLRQDCLPTSRTYTLFIEHLVDSDNLEAASEIFRSMQDMQVMPSRVTFKILINGFLKVGNIDTVLDLLQQMQENFYKPNKQLIPAVEALQAAGKLKADSELVEEVLQNSRSAVEDKMQCCDEEDIGYLDYDVTIWRSVSRSHPGFDVNGFSHALYEWNPKVERVLEQEGLEWDNLLVSEILKRMRCLRSAWNFFHWLKDKAGFKHDSYSCALLIRRILKSTSTLEEKDNLIKELFERMRADGMKFTIPMFNMVMKHFISLGEAEKALNMFKLTRNFQVEPNNISYRQVIEGFAKNRQGKKATELLKEMEAKGFTLDDITCAEMITCFALAGKLERAYALFVSISASGRTPSAIEWKTIMAAYARVGDYAMALKLYDEMRQAGVIPTQDMYDIVTRILRNANRLLDVQELAQQRGLLDFFHGSKKVLQERLLHVLFVFMEGVKVNQPRRKVNRMHLV